LSEERFQLLARATNDVVWDWNPQTDEVWWNEAYETVFGHSRSVASSLDNSWSRFVHPEDYLRVRVSLDRALNQRQPSWQTEYRFRRADGAYVDVLDRGYVLYDARGTPYRMLGSMQDISRRKKVEQQLREQAELLQKARDLIVVTSPDNRIVFWNRSAERVTGWSAAEVMGKSVEEIFGPTMTARAAEVRQAVAEHGAWNGEVTMVNRAGDTVMLDMRITQVRDAAGLPTARLSICTDITDRRKLELELHRAERLDSLGMLAGGIAHDLNNSFAPILMAIDLLRLRVPESENRRILDTIGMSAEHGALLVKQLLAFARGTGGERNEVDVGEVLFAVRNLLRGSLPASIQLQVSTPTNSWPLQADATELKQVFLNLCINARDAMPQGGSIELAVENVVVDDVVASRHPGAQTGPHLRVRVRDTGTGIPPELQAKIFDPFFTTKAAGKGTGLGLSMVAGIVRSHGGFIELDSRLGVGTTFELYFPATIGSSTGDGVYGGVLPQQGRGEVILLIEDDVVVRETCQLLLEKAGYRVVSVHDGATGIAVFRAGPETFAVVVTDMLMPGVQGDDVIREIRRLRPHHPAIVISGRMDAGTRADLERLKPPVVCLLKPVGAQDFLGAVRTLIYNAATATPRSGGA